MGGSARPGAIAAFLGAAALFISTLAHPLGSDPSDASAAFAEYAASTTWVASHLGQFFGFALFAVALVALASTLQVGPAGLWARTGLAGTAAMVAIAAALQAVDGVALKILVDRWSVAPGNARFFAFEAAFAARQIEIGLASLLSIVAGLTIVVYGVAIALSARYPRWLAAVALIGGVGSVAAGIAQAYTGFSSFAMTLSMLASVALLVWAVLAGAFLWRLGVEPARDNDLS